MIERLNLPSNTYGVVIHKKSVVSGSAKISNGTVIMPGVIINTDTIIGKHAIINSNSKVEHDCNLSDYVHILPSATLTGNVKVKLGT